MLKKIRNIILIVLTLIIWSILCIIYGRYSTPEKTKIVKETETKFKYIKVAKTLPELKECYDNPLGIKVAVKDDWIKIIASDGCKYAEKSIQVRASQRYKNTIYFNVGLKTQQFLYYHTSGRFSVGCGVNRRLPTESSPEFDVTIGAGFSF